MRDRSIVLITLLLSACGAPQGNTPATSVHPALELDGPTYIIANPEMMNDSTDAFLKQIQAHWEEVMAANWAELSADPASSSVLNGNRPAKVEVRPGESDASIIMVEFLDYQCPYCKKTAPEIARLLAENPSIRVVYREYPVLGDASIIAAKAVLAAIRQDKYIPLHEALLADNSREGELTKTRIFYLAKSVGLDLIRLKQDMNNSAIDSEIEKNQALAKKISVVGTPTIYVGLASAAEKKFKPHAIIGATSYEDMQARIRAISNPSES